MEEDQVYIFICQATAVSRANAVIEQTHAAVMIMCGAERYLSWLAIYQRECVRERGDHITAHVRWFPTSKVRKNMPVYTRFRVTLALVYER